MYLLEVLSEDKTSEISAVVALSQAYTSLNSTLPDHIADLIVKTAIIHHTRRLTFSPSDHPRITTSSRPTSEYDESETTLRAQLSRFLPPAPTSPPSLKAYLVSVEEVLGKLWNQRIATEVDEPNAVNKRDVREWVPLVTPFVCCLTRPLAIFLGFQKLMDRFGASPTP